MFQCRAPFWSDLCSIRDRARFPFFLRRVRRGDQVDRSQTSGTRESSSAVPPYRTSVCKPVQRPHGWRWFSGPLLQALTPVDYRYLGKYRALRSTSLSRHLGWLFVIVSDHALSWRGFPRSSGDGTGARRWRSKSSLSLCSQAAPDPRYVAVACGDDGLHGRYRVSTKSKSCVSAEPDRLERRSSESPMSLGDGPGMLPVCLIIGFNGLDFSGAAAICTALTGRRNGSAGRSIVVARQEYNGAGSSRF